MLTNNWQKNDFRLVSIVCGIVFSMFLLSLMLTTYNIPLHTFLPATKSTDEDKNKKRINDEIYYPDMVVAAVVNSNAALLVFFLSGLIIYSIRESGFTLYTHLNKNKKNKEKKLKNDNGIRLPGLRQRILFYIFRNGSVVEECQDNVKSRYEKIEGILIRTDLTRGQRKFYTKVLIKADRTHYNWVQTSKNPVKDLRIFAQRINAEKPEEQIYYFFSLCQMFQALDTGSLLFTVICFLSMLVNIIIALLFSYTLSYMGPFIIGIMSLTLHLISKHLSKYYANKYFERIDTVINQCPEILQGRSDIPHSTREPNDFWFAPVTCFIVFALFLFTLMYSTYPAFLLNLHAMLLGAEKQNSSTGGAMFTISMLIIIIVTSILISSIKGLGFTRYARLYRERKTGIQYIADNSKIKLPGLTQRILFHIFRNGSVIEECLDNIKSKYEKIEGILARTDLTKRQRKFFTKLLEKKERPYYEWIQTSANPAEDLANFKSKTDTTPLTYSEVFHCLDIAFLFLAIFCFLSMLINVILMLFSYEFSYVVPFIIGIVSLICHFAAKLLAKSWAVWYLREIDNIFTEPLNS